VRPKTEKQMLAHSVECCATEVKWQSSEMLFITCEFASSNLDLIHVIDPTNPS